MLRTTENLLLSVHNVQCVTLRLSHAGVEVRRVKREEKLSVICTEVVVQRKVEDKCYKKSGVHDEK